MPPFGFNVIGFISANLGLGAAARATIRLLIENGYPVTAVEVDAGFGRSGIDRSFDYLKRPLEEQAPYAINLLHVNPPELDQLFKLQLPWLNDSDRLNAIVPFWELPRVPQPWIPPLERVDLILAPTRFIEHAMATQVNGVPVRHFPHTIFMPDGIAPNRSVFGLPDGVTLFGAGFELLSDSNRKNARAALEAFTAAFPDEKNVRFAVNLNNSRAHSSVSRDRERLRALAAADPRITLLETPLTYPEVLSFYASCDVVVSLHRSEGLGLVPMEAMLLGKPVIATGWSGVMDFMNDANSCLVPYTLIPANSDAKSGYNPGYIGGPTVWADPDVDAAARWMRRLASDPELRRAIGARAAADMAHRHDRCRSGEVFHHVRRLYENRRDMREFSGRRPVAPAPRRRLRVLFMNRANAFDMPGGDTIVMKRLKEELNRNGIAVDCSADPGLSTLGSYDLVHLFNLTLPAVTEAFAKAAVARNVPFVVTTLQEDFPLYYHKAVAAVAWFRAYLDERATKRPAPATLRPALNAAKPIPLVTSPFAARAARLLFACGETEAALLRSSFGHDRVATAPFGSSVKDCPAPGSLFEKEFNVRDFIFCVGRVEPRKNQLMLLLALEELNLPVVFADGGFTYQPEYLALCKKFKRAGPTLYTGRLSDELLVSAYRACRVHCLPSWYELPGLVSLEAARYGCRIAASSWGCLPDYLDGECAWCRPDDPDGIALAVREAYDTQPSQAAAEKARSFTWENFGALTIRHYERVVESHTRYPPELAAQAASRSPEFGPFIERLAVLVESKRVREAIAFYDDRRGSFKEQSIELAKTDELMETLRAKIG